MKKRTIFLILTVLLLVTGTNNIFAANTYKGWFKLPDLNLWVYLKENGQFARGEWLWIEKEDQPGTEKHYYFNTDGFLVCHGTTPDGKKVNALGEEIEEGSTNVIVQKTSVDKSLPNATTENNGVIIQSKKATEEKLSPPVVKTEENKSSTNQIIDASEYKINSNEYSIETIKTNFLSLFMSYKQKIDNRAVTFSKIFQSELKQEDFFNGKSNQLLDIDNAELTRLYEEGAQKLNELVTIFGNNTAAVSECAKYKNLLNSAYITACRNIKHSLDVIANQMMNTK